MKVYITIFVFFSMLFFTSIAQAQIIYKTYMFPQNSFYIYSTSTPINNGVIQSRQTNYVWLNVLNNEYFDTSQKINPSAIPMYAPIKRNALTNPYSVLNQFIEALIPYGYYFPATQYEVPTHGYTN